MFLGRCFFGWGGGGEERGWMGLIVDILHSKWCRIVYIFGR